MPALWISMSGEQWLHKLFTREDKHFVHKFFGFLSLASFIYRYCVVLPLTGNLGFTGSVFDWVTLTLHLGLSVSSLIFHVLAHRILGRPMVMYEEYRLHAIVFTLRSVLMSVYGFMGPFSGDWDSPLEMFIGLGIVAAHHIVVDEITRRHGTPGVTAVRVDEKERSKYTFLTKVAQYMYSYYQIAAIVSHLLHNKQVNDLGFNTLIAIQSSTFLFTLNRKGLISEYVHGVIYSACLFASSYVMFIHAAPGFLLKSLLVYIARINFRMNKYIIWFFLILFTSFPYLVQLDAVKPVVALLPASLASFRF